MNSSIRIGQVFSFLERNHEGVTAREVSKAVDCSLSHIYQIMKALEEKDHVEHFYEINYSNRTVKVFKLKGKYLEV